MTLIIVDIDSVAQVDLGLFNDVFVYADTLLNVAGGIAIIGDGSGHSAYIAGHVTGGTGIRFGGDSTDSNQSVEIFKGGAVLGDTYGVSIRGSDSTVINHGTIAGGSFGIILDASLVGSRDTITNSGTILGQVAISRNSSLNYDIDIYNSGIIIGLDFSFNSLAAAEIDRIFNKGRMDGNISFDGGDDLYDGRGGTLRGSAMGQDGNDVFFGGGGVEFFDGGIGDDTFTGGLGRDRITLGAGADKIIFNTVTEIGDIIADFTTADFFQFKKSAFGNLTTGMLAASAYHESDAGVAHDASDRFIYDLNDDRLYYDRDGTGAAARVLVADVVNDVNISRADIQII